MLWFGAGGATSITFPVLDPPWYRDLTGTVTVFSVWRRSNQPAGETSWTVTASLSAKFIWRIEEWASLSGITNPDAVPSPTNTYFINSAGAQDNHVFSSPGQSITPDVSDFAGLAVWRAGSGTAIWPLRTYSSGWSEVDCLSFGTGATSGDFQIMFAEAYPGVSGAIDPVMTWDTSNGGTYAEGKVVDGWAACYQPAVPVPLPGVLTA